MSDSPAPNQQGRHRGATDNGAGSRASVIVPVRDRRRLVEELLDALSKQTVTDIEIVVVDDGSRDGSGEAASAREGVLVLRTPGVGAVAARRLGVGASSAPVLVFTDSDCVPDPNWIEAGLRAIEEGADLVQGATYPTRQMRPRERTVASGREDGLYASCNLFCRRDAFEAAGGFDEEAGARLGFRRGAVLRGTGFGEDTLLGWRIRRQGRVTFEPGAVVHHHVFPPDPLDTLRRVYAAGAFPALVREVPELRRTLLVDGIFLGSRSRLPLYLSALMRMARRRRTSAVLLVGWAAWRSCAVLRAEPSRKRCAVVVPMELAADAGTAVALLAGSARARRVVL